MVLTPLPDVRSGRSLPERRIMIEEDAVKDALRKSMPGYGYNEEQCAWDCCVRCIAEAFGYEHPSDEWFQFVYDCSPEQTPDWKASNDHVHDE